MNVQLEAAFRAQRGLVTRTAAVTAGLSEREIDQLVRSGEWVAVRRGVYARREHVESLTTPSARQRLRDDAACLTIGLPHVRSHDSAALVLGLPILLPPKPMTHVTRPGIQGSRNRNGVKHHLAPYKAADVVDVDGIRVLGAARTAVDIAREHGEPYGVVAMDSARRAGTDVQALRAAVSPMTCWPGVKQSRRCVELSDSGSDSVGETLARLLATELGRGRPATQFGLRRDGRVAFADLRIGRHLIEFDGKVKYQRPDANRRPMSPEDVLWEEKKRQDWLCGFKLGMSRLVWSDVWGSGRAEALQRLERELADTEARFGTSIEDLAAYVVTRPPRAA